MELAGFEHWASCFEIEDDASAPLMLGNIMSIFFTHTQLHFFVNFPKRTGRKMD